VWWWWWWGGGGGGGGVAVVVVVGWAVVLVVGCGKHATAVHYGSEVKLHAKQSNYAVATTQGMCRTDLALAPYLKPWVRCR
jgi:uncharacterized membrane protein